MRVFSLCLLLFLSACSDPADKTQAPAPGKYRNDYTIGHYMAPVTALASNSYWIEGPAGVILIGTQLLPSATREVLALAESYTGKKVVMAIVLHASAEQFNGVSELQQRGIKVVTARSVVEQIAQQDKLSRSRYLQRFQPDYPAQLALPEAPWVQTQEFSAAGLTLKAYVVRAGQSPSHVLIELDGHLFVGDLVASGYHSSLHLGKSSQWIERLQEIAKFASPRVIHPGRGYAMAAGQLLEQQIKYLHDFQQALAAFYSGGRITPADKASIADKMRQQYPDYALDELLQNGIEAEWERLRQQDHMML